MIKIENISKSFNKTNIINSISATFEKGKTNLVIGQSGSGKTVLMKCLSGLLTPDEGKIMFNNSSFLDSKYKEKLQLKMQMGIVFQSNALLDSKNIEENIMFPLVMFKKESISNMREMVNLALKKVNLDNVNKKMPSEISGGMKKRVAIARAIIMNPKYLFCDEPNSGLDPQNSILIDNLIQKITKENNITTIINSHDMNSVMEIGEKIIFIHKGNKEWEGSNKDIIKTDNKIINDFMFSSSFMNFFKKSHLFNIFLLSLLKIIVLY